MRRALARRVHSVALGLGLAVLLACTTRAQQLPADFYTVRDVPLPGDTSRWDYESLDPQMHRMYVTHLCADTIALYDIAAGAVIGEIRDVPGVHGVLAIPELGRPGATIRMACRFPPTGAWRSLPARGTQNWWSWT